MSLEAVLRTCLARQPLLHYANTWLYVLNFLGSIDSSLTLVVQEIYRRVYEDYLETMEKTSYQT